MSGVSVEIFDIDLMNNNTPLGGVDWLYNLRDLVDKSDTACDMIQDFAESDLLPRHGHILQQLENPVRNILQCSQIYSLIMSILFARQVSMVLYYLSQNLRRKLLLLTIDKPELLLVSVSFLIQLSPFLCCLF